MRRLRIHLFTAVLAWIGTSALAQEAVSPVAPAQAVWPPPKPTTHNYAKWEKAVAAFEAEDKKQVPPAHPVLFVGSSTIVRWKSLAQDFPDLPVLNRGFGGNQIKDSTHYAERMIFPYEPRAIVLRAGGNDINAGWPAEDVFQDYRAFVEKVRGRFPGIPIIYVGLSPTLKRIQQIAEGNKLNDLVAAYCREKEGLIYVDTRDMTLDSAGQPRADLFVADGLHFNAEGYRLLAAKLRPVLTQGIGSRKG